MAKFKKCKNCNGKGFVISDIGDYRKLSSLLNSKPCPLCFGKGSRGLSFHIIRR